MQDQTAVRPANHPAGAWWSCVRHRLV